MIKEGARELLNKPVVRLNLDTLEAGVYVYQTPDEVLYVGMARVGVGARALAPKHEQAHVRAVAREVLVIPCSSPGAASALKSRLLEAYKPIYNQRGVRLTRRHRAGTSVVCVQCQVAAQIDKQTARPFCDDAACGRRGHRLDVAPLPVGASLSGMFCTGCGHKVMATEGAALACGNEGCERLRMPLKQVLSRAKGARR